MASLSLRRLAKAFEVNRVVDAIDLEGVVDGRKWWEGLSKESDKKERSQ